MIVWAVFTGIILVTILPGVFVAVFLVWAMLRSETLTLGPELMAQEKSKRAKYWWMLLLFLGLIVLVGIVLRQFSLPVVELAMTFFVVSIMLLACGLVSWAFWQLAQSHQKIYLSRSLTQVVVLVLGLLTLVWGLLAGIVRAYNEGEMASFPFMLILCAILLAFGGLIPNAITERGVNFNSAFIGWPNIKGYAWHIKAGQTDVLTIHLDQTGQSVRHIPIPAEKKAAVQTLLDQYSTPI